MTWNDRLLREQTVWTAPSANICDINMYYSTIGTSRRHDNPATPTEEENPRTFSPSTLRPQIPLHPPMPPRPKIPHRHRLRLLQHLARRPRNPLRRRRRRLRRHIRKRRIAIATHELRFLDVMRRVWSVVVVDHVVVVRQVLGVVLEEAVGEETGRGV